MDSLTTGKVADVLDRLYQEAKITDEVLMEAFIAKGVGTSEEMVNEILAAEERDYKELYRNHAGYFLAVSPAFGRFIYMCARASKAKCIVEFVLSILPAPLRDNGGGQLIGTEPEPTKAQRARANLEAAGLGDLVEIRVGDALETLKDGIGGDLDLVMLDGPFSLYLPVLKLLERHLRAGALILGENAFERAPGYIDYVRNPQNGYLSQRLPFEAGRGNEFTVFHSKQRTQNVRC